MGHERWWKKQYGLLSVLFTVVGVTALALSDVQVPRFSKVLAFAGGGMIAFGVVYCYLSFHKLWDA